MNQKRVVGAMAAVALVAGAVYFTRDFTDEPAASIGSARPEAAPAQDSHPPPAALPLSQGAARQRPVASDPRLAALMQTPDNALIEFLADPEGRVIRELDNDPVSASYRKPLREYTYAGDRVIRLVKYQYAGGETQVITADVVYRPDGGVDRYHEATRYEYAKP